MHIQQNLKSSTERFCGRNCSMTFLSPFLPHSDVFNLGTWNTSPQFPGSLAGIHSHVINKRESFKKTTDTGHLFLLTLSTLIQPYLWGKKGSQPRTLEKLKRSWFLTFQGPESLYTVQNIPRVWHWEEINFYLL